MHIWYVLLHISLVCTSYIIHHTSYIPHHTSYIIHYTHTTNPAFPFCYQVRNKVHPYNLDARAFVRRLHDEQLSGKVLACSHVILNLPQLSIDFLGNASMCFAFCVVSYPTTGLILLCLYIYIYIFFCRCIFRSVHRHWTETVQTKSSQNPLLLFLQRHYWCGGGMCWCVCVCSRCSHEYWYVWCMMYDVWCMMYDVWCMM